MSAQFQLFLHQQQQAELLAQRIKSKIISQESNQLSRQLRSNYSSDLNEFFKKSFYEFRKYNNLENQPKCSRRTPIIQIIKKEENTQNFNNICYIHEKLEKNEISEIFKLITQDFIYINQDPDSYQFSNMQNKNVKLQLISLADWTQVKFLAKINSIGKLEIDQESFNNFLLNQRILIEESVYLFIVKFQNSLVYQCLIQQNQLLQQVEKQITFFINENNNEQNCLSCLMQNRVLLVFNVYNKMNWIIEMNKLELTHFQECSQNKQDFVYSSGEIFQNHNQEIEIENSYIQQEQPKDISYNVCLGKNIFSEQTNIQNDDHLLKILKFIKPQCKTSNFRINQVIIKKDTIQNLRPKSTIIKQNEQIEKFNGIQKQQLLILKKFDQKKKTEFVKKISKSVNQQGFGVNGRTAKFYQFI